MHLFLMAVPISSPAMFFGMFRQLQEMPASSISNVKTVLIFFLQNYIRHSGPSLNHKKDSSGFSFSLQQRFILSCVK
jgi:hypothetical protein